MFPLPGALLLPRGQMPLNIFEPRYLAMIDDALRDRHRLIGMIQPDTAHPGPEDKPNLYKIGCVGRITQLAETGDGRYLIAAHRRRALPHRGGARRSLTAYRQCRVDLSRRSPTISSRARARTRSTARRCSKALAGFLKANKLKTDWDGIEKAPNEALVNALAMMSPYGAAEKQAMLEAPDLKTRAEILVALTEIELAKSENEGETQAAIDALQARAIVRATSAGMPPCHRTSRRQRRSEAARNPGLPADQGPARIRRDKQELISRAAKLAYPIRDGIPIMLPEEARRLD